MALCIYIGGGTRARSNGVQLRIQPSTAKAEQESARMEFVLQKGKLEAQRKSIEAEGIADFQRIVSKGITSDLLQWKGIEATTKLANSENTKIVIMGNGKNSLPVILGDNAK